jgi:sugar diacid utilization regulator
MPTPTPLPISEEDSALVSAIGGGPMSFGTITLEVSAADGSHDHDDDARFALQYASTALGLLMAHEKAMGEMENRLSRDLIEDLLDDAAPDAAVARAAAHGHDLRSPHDVVVVMWPLAEPRTDHADPSIEQLRKALHRQRKPFLLTRRQGALVVLAHQGVDIKRLYEDLASELGRPHGLVAMGEPAMTPRQVPRAYEQARRALAARRVSGEPWGCIAYSDLGVDRILAVEGNTGEVERLITQWLDELIKYDQDRGGDLVLTLATYLDRGGKYDEAANALSIHRNTLRYRLRRIAEISGHDLADSETSLNLHLATRAWRLRVGPTPGPGTPSS